MFKQFTLGIEEDLGSREEIGHIYTILERGTSADEQLQVWRKTGDIKAVVDRLIEATMENVPCGVIPVALNGGAVSTRRSPMTFGCGTTWE
jgi:hypothetical protein